MAPPDVNSMPSSQRSTAPSHPSSSTSSRRASQMTGTPLIPGVQSSGFGQNEDGGVPMRHPRPLTAAELHLELEKEQEAVVNRLARELSNLRAQHSASVASTASSSQSSAVDHTLAQGTIDVRSPVPIPSPRQRSSSSVSARSITGPTPPHALGPNMTSQASVDRARDAAGMRSRDNSLVSGSVSSVSGAGIVVPSRSRAPSLGPSPSIGMAFGDVQPGSLGQRRGSSVSTTSRLEEMEKARAQLEIARKENEMLVARVKELEGMLMRNGSGDGGHRADVDGEAGG